MNDTSPPYQKQWPPRATTEWCRSRFVALEGATTRWHRAYSREGYCRTREAFVRDMRAAGFDEVTDPSGRPAFRARWLGCPVGTSLALGAALARAVEQCGRTVGGAELAAVTRAMRPCAGYLSSATGARLWSHLVAETGLPFVRIDGDAVQVMAAPGMRLPVRLLVMASSHRLARDRGSFETDGATWIAFSHVAQAERSALARFLARESRQLRLVHSAPRPGGCAPARSWLTTGIGQEIAR